MNSNRVVKLTLPYFVFSEVNVCNEILCTLLISCYDDLISQL